MRETRVAEAGPGASGEDCWAIGLRADVIRQEAASAFAEALGQSEKLARVRALHHFGALYWLVGTLFYLLVVLLLHMDGAHVDGLGVAYLRFALPAAAWMIACIAIGRRMSRRFEETLGRTAELLLEAEDAKSAGKLLELSRLARRLGPWSRC